MKSHIRRPEWDLIGISFPPSSKPHQLLASTTPPSANSRLGVKCIALLSIQSRFWSITISRFFPFESNKRRKKAIAESNEYFLSHIFEITRNESLSDGMPLKRQKNIKKCQFFCKSREDFGLAPEPELLLVQKFTVKWEVVTHCDGSASRRRFLHDSLNSHKRTFESEKCHKVATPITLAFRKIIKERSPCALAEEK